MGPRHKARQSDEMRRILVVEDDPDLRELLTFNLAREGFDIDAVERGGEALRRCRHSPPDLVLLDMMLPDCSGLEVCQALRRSPDTGGVPIIFLTACRTEPERIRGLEVGADDYLSKPFNMRELILRIHALLKRSTERAERAEGRDRDAPSERGERTPPTNISPQRVAHREQLRVWNGFAANHMSRAEWREAREIWRAILSRFEADLSNSEVIGIKGQIDDCERALANRRVS
jgi:DNA-binding response OmpR family regulator